MSTLAATFSTPPGTPPLFDADWADATTLAPLAAPLAQISQFSVKTQMGAPDRVQFVNPSTTPAGPIPRQGNYSLRMEVRPGDYRTGYAASGYNSRVQVASYVTPKTYFEQGADLWSAVSLRLDPTFTIPPLNTATRGVWAAGTAYAVNDRVQGSDAKIYIALNSTTGTNPVTDTAFVHWFPVKSIFKIPFQLWGGPVPSGTSSQSPNLALALNYEASNPAFGWGATVAGGPDTTPYSVNHYWSAAPTKNVWHDFLIHSQVDWRSAAAGGAPKTEVWHRQVADVDLASPPAFGIDGDESGDSVFTDLNPNLHKIGTTLYGLWPVACIYRKDAGPINDVIYNGGVRIRGSRIGAEGLWA